MEGVTWLSVSSTATVSGKEGARRSTEKKVAEGELWRAIYIKEEGNSDGGWGDGRRSKRERKWRWRHWQRWLVAVFGNRGGGRGGRRRVSRRGGWCRDHGDGEGREMEAAVDGGQGKGIGEGRQFAEEPERRMAVAMAEGWGTTVALDLGDRRGRTRPEQGAEEGEVGELTVTKGGRCSTETEKMKRERKTVEPERKRKQGRLRRRRSTVVVMAGDGSRGKGGEGGDGCDDEQCRR